MNVSADALVIAITVLAFVGALVMRVAFETWQYTKNKKAIVAAFGRRKAIDPGSARPLEEMGLKLATWRIGLRDYRAETMRALLHNGFLQRTIDGRVYLSPEAYQFYTTQCDK